MDKAYLGDGAYVSHDGYALVLTAEDGARVHATIVLEPETLVALIRYAIRAGLLPTDAVGILAAMGGGK